MFSCLFKKKDKNKEIMDKIDKFLEERRKKRFSVDFWPHDLYVIPEEPEEEERVCAKITNQGLRK
jgi:hypothetical protein